MPAVFLEHLPSLLEDSANSLYNGKYAWHGYPEDFLEYANSGKQNEILQKRAQ